MTHLSGAGPNGLWWQIWFISCLIWLIEYLTGVAESVADLGKHLIGKHVWQVWLIECFANCYDGLILTLTDSGDTSEMQIVALGNRHKQKESTESEKENAMRMTNVTCSHEMIVKLRHAVPSISLKTVVGVNLGEIEIFALCRSSLIFAPYTCSFLIVFDP